MFPKQKKYVRIRVDEDLLKEFKKCAMAHMKYRYTVDTMKNEAYEDALKCFMTKLNEDTLAV